MDRLLIPTLFCPKAWAGMAGDEKTRLCTYCNKHVHNLDALSASERLALLSSPAATVCSRYTVALRRPAKGKEQSYYRHLLKYGVGVAAAGSVLLVLWEMKGEADKEAYYRASGRASGCAMPRDYYEEHYARTKGEVSFSSRELALQKLMQQDQAAAKALAEERARQDAELVIAKKTMDGMIDETASDPVIVKPE